MDESPKFYLATGKPENAQIVLEKMARINQKESIIDNLASDKNLEKSLLLENANELAGRSNPNLYTVPLLVTTLKVNLT